MANQNDEKNNVQDSARTSNQNQRYLILLAMIYNRQLIRLPMMESVLLWMMLPTIILVSHKNAVL